MADERQEQKDFEDYPLTRAEYIAAMVHLYRGEQHRAQVWRLRLDATTNWAVLSVGAMLSYAFNTDRLDAHLVLVLGMYMVFTMLVFESRRFRFYDVWRNRVRRIEENFYVPILRRDLTSPMENWGYYVAEDLLNPTYKITFFMAMKARLMNNYLPFFLVLLGSWLFKVEAHTVVKVGAKAGDTTFYERLGAGELPPWVPLSGVMILYGFLFFLLFFTKRTLRPEEIYFGSSRGDSIDDVG